MPHDVGPERNEADRIVETPAGQRPPLSCRTSPPQGGRSAVINASLAPARSRHGPSVKLVKPEDEEVKSAQF